MKLLKMLRLSFLLILLCASTMYAQTTDAAYAKKLKSLYKGTVTTLQPLELHSAIKSGQAFHILDTRANEEFAVSHIAGAKFIEYSKFNKKDVAELDRTIPVVVYCTVGYRSERIGEQLKKLGFTTVFNLYGGIFEWVNQGYPVVDAAGNPTQKVHAYSEDWGVWLKKGEKVYQ